jgi:hypothetical protein
LGRVIANKYAAGAACGQASDKNSRLQATKYCRFDALLKAAESLGVSLWCHEK